MIPDRSFQGARSLAYCLGIGKLFGSTQAGRFARTDMSALGGLPPSRHASNLWLPRRRFRRCLFLFRTAGELVASFAITHGQHANRQSTWIELMPFGRWAHATSGPDGDAFQFHPPSRATATLEASVWTSNIRARRRGAAYVRWSCHAR